MIRIQIINKSGQSLALRELKWWTVFFLFLLYLFSFSEVIKNKMNFLRSEVGTESRLLSEILWTVFKNLAPMATTLQGHLKCNRAYNTRNVRRGGCWLKRINKGRSTIFQLWNDPWLCVKYLKRTALMYLRTRS